MRPDPVSGASVASSYFGQRPRLLVLTLIVMFALAMGVRLQRLDAPGVLIDRDYTSAMFARAFYFAHDSTIPAWRREMATKLMMKQPTLEPPVTEWMTALIYRVAGREDIRFGRVLTIIFWLAGGALFFLLARLLTDADAALVALGYYLFLPLSVVLSRSFQADALMMLLFIGGLLAIVRYRQDRRNTTLAVAIIVSALALVYRPLVMPALVLAWVIPEMRISGWRRALFSRASLTFLILTTLPAFAYYGYGAFVARYFQWKLTSSFMFSLYRHPEFWREWFLIATTQLWLPALLLALLGLPFLIRDRSRDFVVALALGYLCFGLAFTYHIHTHGYYQAQLIPAVGIALAPLTVVLIRKAFAAPERWVRVAPFMAAGIVAGVWGIDIRTPRSAQTFESPTVAAEIGAQVNHSDRVVFLSPFYGLPLQYLGEFTGAYWPRRIEYWLYRRKGERELSVSERLAALGFEPEYFVITHFREYANHHDDLRTFLEQRCEALAITDAYHIYGRCATGDRRTGSSGQLGAGSPRAGSTPVASVLPGAHGRS